MKNADACTASRELLSALRDGELPGGSCDAEALAAHLGGCADCREHAAALERLAHRFDALRTDGAATRDLWQAIEARLVARRRPAVLRRVLSCAAAALVGFLGIGAAALAVDRGRPDAPGARHALERLAASSMTPDELLGALPEYRLLRLVPNLDESR